MAGEPLKPDQLRVTTGDHAGANGPRTLETGDLPGGAHASGAPAGGSLPPDTLIAERVGPYKVHHELGRGGMGTVYLATRDDDTFHRRVALKLLRKGMDTDDVLKRFELERQVLTALNHPNIARVYDAGQSADGRPFFALEYVEGLAIDLYCDRNRLSTDQRLKIFGKVCAAVHHAHKNGIIHRDLKPANILVSKEGEPKLLDFGIAKLVNPDLAGVTLVTGPELRVMTPEYASPEQVSGEPLTTASDVYSLGVLLYQLLTGHRPYSFKTRVRDEIVRVVQEVEPAAPSTAVTKVQTITADDGTTRTITVDDVAKTRDERPDALQRRLRGDLDNIVLMAMHKSPAKRYESAADFAQDLERHLEGFPVSARPRTFAYEAARFVRRHRGPVAAATAVLAVAMIGAIAVSWQVNKRAKDRALAEQLSKQVAEQDRRLLATRNFAGQLIEDLQKRLQRADGSLAAREALARASTRTLDYLASEFPEDSELGFYRAQAWRRMGEVQGGRGSNLNQLDQAGESFAAASKQLDAIQSGAIPPATLLAARAGLLVEQADLARRRGDRQTAADLLARCDKLLDAAQPDVAESRDVMIERSHLLLAQSVLKQGMGDLPAARSLASRSLEVRQSVLRSTRPDTPQARVLAMRDVSVALSRLASIEASAQDSKAQRQFLLDSLAIRAELAAMPESDQTARRDLAMAQREMAFWIIDHAPQDRDQALDLLEKSLAGLRALQESSPDDLRARADFGEALNSLAELQLSVDPVKARVFAQSAAESFATLTTFNADRPGFAKGLARALLYRGQAEAAIGQSSDSLRSYSEGLDALKNFADADEEAKVLRDALSDLASPK